MCFTRRSILSRHWLRLLVLAVGFEHPGAIRAALPAHLFADFESAAGWRAGALPLEKAGFRLIQGLAAVAANAEADSAQVLVLGPSSPFAAVFVETTAVAKAPVVFCEMLVQPPAVAGEADAEFLDFGGAVVGFFRQGGSGEVRVLFARSAEESVWISCGPRFALDESGCAAGWLRIAVRLDRRTERWSLRVNGVKVLAGLRALPGEAAGLPLWLYGQEGQPCRVDDLLVTTVEPADLQKMIEWQHRRAGRGTAAGPEISGAKLVTRALPSHDLRSAQPPIREATARLCKPVVRAWEMSLHIGDATFKGGPETEIEGRKTSLLVYSPQYDDAGRPLPGAVTITADAELRPGVELSRLRWMIAEIKKWPDELGEVVTAGDFGTGLVQTATIPPEWIRKATTVQVWVAPGSGDVPWWNYKHRLPQTAPPP